MGAAFYDREKMMEKQQFEFELKEEDCICANCKYYGGCDRSRNCDTICEKWDISGLALEDLMEERM